MALGKKLRNRVIGALVIVALAMILIPAVMDPGQTYKKGSDSIAVDSSGAVSDAAASDYSDLLAPIEDNALTPEQVAAQNSGKSLAVSSESASSASGSTDEGSLDLVVPPEPIPADPQAQVERLKQAQSARASRDPAVANPESEVLVSSHTKSDNSQSIAPAKPAHGSETLVSKRQSASSSPVASTQSGGYTVQAGVFSQRANADKVISKLRAAGISARAANATINGQSMTRVYAGSAKTREAAEGIAKRVQQVIGTKPSVVQL